MSGGDRTVWSDERGGAVGGSRDEPKQARPAPRGGRRERGVDRARQAAAADPDDGVVRVRREMKGRRGKPVTTVSGVPGGDAALRELAGDLKRHCGTGGSSKGGVIEIQGDHRDKIISLLEERGIRCKRAGG